MCPPDHYGIEYEINPWMSLERQADCRLAREQWQALYEFLSAELKLDVKLIQPVPGLPDMVFTANAGLAMNKRFISSNFRAEERRGESRYYDAWFKERGYSVHTLPSDLYFEGEGDVLFADERNAYAGYLIRSDANAHAMVAELLGVRIVSLLTGNWCEPHRVTRRRPGGCGSARGAERGRSRRRSPPGR